MLETSARLTDTPDLLRHLVRMQQAGLPWLQSLQMWRDGCRRPEQAESAQRLMDAVGQGLSLTEALSQGGWLSRPLQALSRAGEASGTWAQQMAQWLARHDQQARMMRQVRSATAYPLLVLFMAALVLVGVLVWVLPVFQTLYRSLNAELPWATRSLLALSDLASTLGWWVGPLPWLGWACWVAGWRQTVWRPRLERWVWRCPALGSAWQLHLESLWCGLMSQLLQAGLDWNAALSLAGPASGSPWLSRASADMGHDLEQGLGLAAAMAGTNRRLRPLCGREM